MTSPADGVIVCMAHERELLQSAVRSSPEALERLLDPDFREIGASGTLWSRPAMIEALTQAGSDPDWTGPISDEDMEGCQLSDALVLLTYISDASGRRARRSSLWRQSEGSWRLLHHQGTLLLV